MIYHSYDTFKCSHEVTALSLQMARETREIEVRVRNEPLSKPSFKKFNIEEFPVIDIDGTTQWLV